MNHKRLFRLYREERLIVPHRGGRKRTVGIQTPTGNVKSLARSFCEGGLALQLPYDDVEEATLLARHEDPPGCAQYGPSRASISVILRAMR